ncbi:8113_t:CDS:2 [Cetraspora pellucida]|uniref:8113_t:CDS:1 n=1 Tax=Cetraspora pellucida TaxID=1433469 RepID=A0ACA9KU73_9GLOM|nr:8113_t:CDS:2 [Cetraspora pellucida]
MASKIFIGSMLELMKNIFNNLENEYNTLYSCILLAFVLNYFSFLNEDEKFILEEYRINLEFFKTLFNYARFLKVLNLFCLKSTVQE